MLLGFSRTGWESDGGEKEGVREDREVHREDKQWLTRAFSTIQFNQPSLLLKRPPSQVPTQAQTMRAG